EFCPWSVHRPQDRRKNMDFSGIIGGLLDVQRAGLECGILFMDTAMKIARGAEARPNINYVIPESNDRELRSDITVFTERRNTYDGTIGITRAIPWDDESRVPVVLAPGWSGGSSMYMRAIRQIAAQKRSVVAIDHSSCHNNDPIFARGMDI